MTSSLVIQNQLVALGVELDLLLKELEKKIASINQSSAETLVEIKKGLRERFEEWQRSLYRAREQVATLPHEINRSEVVQNLREMIERCEKEIRSLQIHPLLEDWLKRSKIFASRAHLQWGRKIFHTVNGLFSLWLYAWSGLPTFVFKIISTFFVSVIVVVEVVRRRSPRVNEFVCKAMGGLMREREKKGVTSATWYMVSMFAVLLFCPREVFILTLFYVAVGDTAAGIVGSRWGRHRLSPHVSLEGSLAAFGVCFLITLAVTPTGLGAFHLTGLKLLLFSFLGGLIGALAEGVFKNLDDNLVIPLVAAPSLWVLIRIFV